MSFDSENLSSDSNSSLISFNSIEYHEWESRVVQYNHHTDRILEDVIINYSDLVIQDQPTRARIMYRDREREQGETRLMTRSFIIAKMYRSYTGLAYETSFDVVDEYLRMRGVVIRNSLISFI
ncbi:hypothetical protein Tco_0709202 [Tanacetum coccineum]